MTNAGWSGNNSPRRFSTRLSLKAMAPWSKPPGSANKARTYRTTVSGDRKSTRLNSSHANISYAVFCLKKKKKLDRRSMLTPEQFSTYVAEDQVDTGAGDLVLTCTRAARMDMRVRRKRVPDCTFRRMLY